MIKIILLYTVSHLYISIYYAEIVHMLAGNFVFWTTEGKKATSFSTTECYFHIRRMASFMFFKAGKSWLIRKSLPSHFNMLIGVKAFTYCISEC